MANLSMKDIKAVGGCQTDALVNLLQKMGHEVEVEADGALVSKGDQARFRGQPAIIVSWNNYSEPCDGGVSFVYLEDKRLVSDHYSSVGIANQDSLCTLDGKIVRGYAK